MAGGIGTTMTDNHIIPVSNGLFEHRERIGPAIWEFLWCIDRVTREEVDDNGERWGLVLGGVPIKYDRVALDLKSSEQTVKRNMQILKEQQYISSVRASRGQILKVAKNKKNVETRRRKSESPPPNDNPKMDDHDGVIAQKWTITDERESKNGLSEGSDSSKMDYLKDFTITTTTSTTTETAQFEILLNEFCEIHSKLDIHVKAPDIMLMTELIALGVPLPLISKVMRTLHKERTQQGARISTFSYYKSAILESWETQKAITDGVPIPEGVPLSPVALGSAKKTKQQQSLEELRRKAREAREHEQS
jgi:hypothetical protein